MKTSIQNQLDKIWRSNDIKSRPIKILKHQEKDPEISVIIPVHNAEAYLHRCLNSVLSQKISVSIEILTIYDRSEDNSERILQEYAERGSVVLYRANVTGPSEARNVGIEHARGRYLIFIDADDYLTYNNYFQDMYDRIEETGSDLVQSGYIKTEEQKVISVFSPSNDEAAEYERLKKTVPGFSWGKIMKKDLFEGISYPVDYWFEDSIFHMIILRRCRKAAFIKSTGYAYRKNIKGITYSKDKSKRSVEAVTVIPKILSMMKEAGEPIDEVTTETVLEHSGLLLENRIRRLSFREQKTAFLFLADVINGLPIIQKEKPMYDIYMKKRFIFWKLLCLKRRILRGG